MNQRTILYIALGLILFSLWDAWQKDYPPARSFDTDIAKKAQISPIVTDDSIAIEEKYAAKKRAYVRAPKGRLISVHTDVLEIAIDTVGGNIVSSKLLKYPKEVGNVKRVVQALSDDDENLRIAASALISEEGPDKSLNKQARYKAASKQYSLNPKDQDLEVKLNWDRGDGLYITKIFTFKRGHYDIKVTYEIDNRRSEPWSGRFFAWLQHKRVFKKKKGLFQLRTFTGATFYSEKNGYEKLNYDKLEQESLAITSKNGWIAFQEKYFLNAWVPNQEKTHNYFSEILTDQIYILGLNNDVVVPTKDKTVIESTLYTGPELADNLKPIAKNLDLTIDYGWFWVISVALFWLMKQIYRFIGNWGWSIVLVTILIKAAFYKFAEKSYRSMAKMRDLTPKIKALKERYGEDRQKLSQATMELYKKEKINPLGGCLPVLIQIPVFIALYYVLVEAVELRHAPFIFWIQDLSAKDPYYVLPILMGLSMLLQQRLNPPPADPMQAKLMMFLPIAFTAFFITFPAGLVLYWFVNNCLSILQQWYIMWQMEKTKGSHP